MASAISHVFALPELLERILLHCDPQTLLQARTVSRCFNELMTASPQIQYKLFLKPYKKVLVYPINNEKELVPQVIITPFLLEPEDGSIYNIVRPEDMAEDIWMIFAFRENFCSRTTAKNASCRKMHLTSPPVTKIELNINHHEDPDSGKPSKWLPGSTTLGHGWYNLFGCIERPNGVLFGDLLDVLDDVGVAGDLSNFHVEMGTEVDEFQREEVNCEGERYEQKDLVKVEVDDERLMKTRFYIVVEQQKLDMN